MAHLSTMLLRRRGMLLKLVVALPTLWLLLSLFTLNDSKLDDKDTQANIPLKAREEAEIESNHIRENVIIKEPVRVAPEPPKQAEEPSTEPPHEIHPAGGVLLPPQEPNGPGEMGKPVVLPKDLDAETKAKVDKGWQDNAFNQYVSDMISVHRTLPDPRDEWCKAPGRYLDNLPQTSVIVCFHNEAWSVLLRTVHSILDRSPDHLLKEIILVDDKSDMAHLQQQLEDYMAQYPKVKVVRAQKREGLIRARLIGATAATAPVLTFLDSHCECTTGWLEPLLGSIAVDPHIVACPVIDVLSDDNFEYHFRDASGVNVGGFDWNLQ
ncbi:unnamed protein product, partial [Meganyctiphanes norvegica]